MSKKTKAVVPYKVNMVISLDGLEGLPEDTSAPSIFRHWVIKSVLLFSTQSKGMAINHHRQLRRIREMLDHQVDLYGQGVKKTVLESIRSEFALEGLELWEVKNLVELLTKAEQQRFIPAKDKLKEILESESKEEAAEVVLEPEDWKFVMQSWNESRKPGEANEVIMRIDDNLKEAQRRHDKEQGSPEEEEVVGPSVE
jgi:hypothetical protein